MRQESFLRAYIALSAKRSALVGSVEYWKRRWHPRRTLTNRQSGFRVRTCSGRALIAALNWQIYCDLYLKARSATPCNFSLHSGKPPGLPACFFLIPSFSLHCSVLFSTFTRGVADITPKKRNNRTERPLHFFFFFPGKFASFDVNEAEAEPIVQQKGLPIPPLPVAKQYFSQRGVLAFSATQLAFTGSQYLGPYVRSMSRVRPLPLSSKSRILIPVKLYLSIE